MSSDPSLLEDGTLALHMALCFGWVAAKGTGGRGCNAPFMERSIAWKCSSYRLEHLFLCCGNDHIPQHISQYVLGRSIHAAVNGSAGGEASVPARPRFGLSVRLRQSSAALWTRSSRTFTSHSTHASLYRKCTASGSRSIATGRPGSKSAAAAASTSAALFRDIPLYAPAL